MFFKVTARLLPRLDEDTRLIPILDNLSQGFLAGISSEWANASGSETDEIKAEMVDELAQKDFPLCMRMHHENLRRDQHLKHFGRLEYGLFLKVQHSPSDEVGMLLTVSIGSWSLHRRSHSLLAQVFQ
jgi:DNA primase large subunit